MHLLEKQNADIMSCFLNCVSKKISASGLRKIILIQRIIFIAPLAITFFFKSLFAVHFCCNIQMIMSDGNLAKAM